MKSIKLLSIAIATILFTACSSDDDNTPTVVNEEEVITTLIATLTSTASENITLRSQDLDGDGPNAPIITVSSALTASTTYNGSMVLLNETVTPAENITEEVIEEAEEHQILFVSNGLDVNTTYTDEDANGNPLGVEFTLTTGEAGTGTITIVLRHEPTKPNDGTLTGAGGETDAIATFPIEIE